MFSIKKNRDRFAPVPRLFERLRARLRNLISRSVLDEHADPRNWGIG